MKTPNGVKEKIVESLDLLPDETLPEVLTFLEYLHFRQTHPGNQEPRYVPVALAGLWQGVTISDDDIAEVRREMWRGFGELDE